MNVINAGQTKDLPITGSVGILDSSQVIRLDATLNVLNIVIGLLPLGLAGIGGWAVQVVSGLARITVPVGTPAGVYRVKIGLGATVEFEVQDASRRRNSD